MVTTAPGTNEDGNAQQQTFVGLPTMVEFDGKKRAVEGIVEVWRVDDEWWRDYICRRYVDVSLEGGGHVVLFQDLVSGEWFVQDP